MKLLITSALLSLPTLAIADTFYTHLPVKAATIYPQGALISREVNVDVPAGVHEIIMALPPTAGMESILKLEALNAQTQSIQIGQEIPFDPEVFYTQAQKDLLDQIDTQNDLIADIDRQLDETKLTLSGLVSQATYLQQIKPSTETPQSIEELQAITEFLPGALAQNAAARNKVEQQIAKLQDDMSNASEALQILTRQRQVENLPTQDWMVATIAVKTDTPLGLELFGQGFTGNIGWSMSYDVKLSADEAMVTLDRTANISQMTEETWIDVRVTLSSAKPFQQLKPVVPNRDVVELVVAAEKYMSGSLAADRSVLMQPAVIEAVEESAAMTGGIGGSFDGVAVEYELPNLISMTGNFGSIERIALDTLEVSAQTDRYASARRDKTAFVRTKLTNLTGEPILSGSANYYRGGNLVNNNRIDLIATGAEATLFFGPDDTLPLKMQFLSELSGDTGFISRSNTREEEMAFQITNNGGTTQTVTMVYSLPISIEEEVAVRVTTNPNPTRDRVDGVQGRSEWDIELAPGQTQSFALGVTITWPDDALIQWDP